MKKKHPPNPLQRGNLVPGIITKFPKMSRENAENRKIFASLIKDPVIEFGFE